MAKKGHTNNPHGRPKVEDRKIMIGVYVRESQIRGCAPNLKGEAQLKQGKKNIVSMMKQALNIE